MLGLTWISERRVSWQSMIASGVRSLKTLKAIVDLKHQICFFAINQCQKKRKGIKFADPLSQVIVKDHTGCSAKTVQAATSTIGPRIVRCAWSAKMVLAVQSTTGAKKKIFWLPSALMVTKTADTTTIKGSWLGIHLICVKDQKRLKSEWKRCRSKSLNLSLKQNHSPLPCLNHKN